MNNLVVQLLLKTGTFSTDLKTARGQVQNFQKGCQTAGQSVSGFSKALGINVGALTKLGGAVGIAVAAGKELKAIIDSNQTSADAFQGVIAGCTGVLETFNQAIATADFSAFRDGLWSVYDAAKAARDAIDALQDASLAYGYLSKKNQTSFQEAYNMYKDPQATAEMKEAARTQMQEAVDAQFEYANVYGKKQMKAYVTQVIKEAGKSNISENNVTNAQFVRAMNIKLGLEGDTDKVQDELERQYRQYLAKSKEYGKNNITAQEQLKREYADVIAIRAMVKGMNNDQLKDVVQIVSGMEDAQQQALSMEKTMNRAQKADLTTKHTSTKAVKDEIVAQKESLEWWKKIQMEAQKHRDNEVYNSQSWNEYNDILDEALRKIEQINAEVARAHTNAKYGEMIANPITAPSLTGQVVNTAGEGGLADGSKVKRSVNEINALIQKYTELRDNLKEGDSLIEFYNQKIEQLGIDLERINKTGLKTPAVSKESIDSWSEFNNAMSATSTIVSNLSQTFKDGTELTASSILSMVSTVLPAIGTLISAIDALTVTEAVEAGVGAVEKAVNTSQHWIEAIAAVAALGSVVAAAIAAAQKPKGKKYASGGIVGGNSFYGDRVVANVNSGEMILNKNQQARLFQMANSGGMGGQVEFHISGTDLVGVLNNQTRKNKLIR